MATRTWVGRFAITQGQPQEEGPRLRSFPRQRPDEEEDELYVLVDPTSSSSEEYAGQLVNAIGRGYQGDPLSLTGALLRSIKAAHQQLRQWNQRSLPEQQISAGVSCLAVRGRVAYLAQVGPITAYSVADGNFQRIEPEEEAAEPLGRLEQVEPDFKRFQLNPGDLLLLASPKIAEILDEEALRSILMRDANEALVELFRLVRDQQQFALVLLACVVEPEGEATSGAVGPPTLQPESAPLPDAPPQDIVPAAAPPAGIGSVPMPSEGAGPAEAPSQEEQSIQDAVPEESEQLQEQQLKEQPEVNAPPAIREDETAEAVQEPRHQSAEQQVAPPDPPGAPSEEEPAPSQARTQEDWLPKTEPIESGADKLAREQATPPPLEEERRPPSQDSRPEEPAVLSDEVAATVAALDQEPQGATPPEGLSQPKVRLKGDDANIRYPRTTGLRAGFPRVPPRAIAAVLVIVVAALLAWYILPPVLEESREDQFTTLMDEARIALRTADDAADPDLRRQSLRSANEALLEAEGLRPEDPEVPTLLARVDAALTELDAVLELPELELIVDVSERLAGPVSANSLALGGGGAYLLDSEEERVIAISLLGPNPEPAELIRGGDAVGAATAGPPQHMAWAEEMRSLLILDDARRLIAVLFGEAPRLVPVRDAQAWGSADGIAYADGNLYVLDVEGDQVWRYRGTESGFDSEREALLPQDTDLDGADEMSVLADIYLIVDDAILHFRDRTALAFTQAGIDEPLASPASLIPLSGSDHVLVADRGNKRIVVFSSDGVFRQQWVSPAAFTDLRAIAVDEPNNLLYILAGTALYRTPLPPPLPEP